MMKNAKHVCSVGIACLLAVALVTCPAAAQEEQDLDVQWGKGHETMRFAFDGETVQYPQDMVTGEFPPSGEPPESRIESQWPVTTYRARWTASTKDWPAEQRANALEFLVLRACDADAFAKIYPKAVSSSEVTSRPEFWGSVPPGSETLAAAMRGKRLGYELVAPGGFGAPDALIKTGITFGLSADGKTLMYHDDSESISENLLDRSILFAARDMGDQVRFEIRGYYVGVPRRLFRDKALSRTRETMAYLIQEMYEYFSAAATDDEIDRYRTFVAGESDAANDPPEAQQAETLNGNRQAESAGAKDADPPAASLPANPSPSPTQYIVVLLVLGAVMAVLLAIRAKRSARGSAD